MKKLVAILTLLSCACFNVSAPINTVNAEINNRMSTRQELFTKEDIDKVKPYITLTDGIILGTIFTGGFNGGL